MIQKQMLQAEVRMRKTKQVRSDSSGEGALAIFHVKFATSEVFTGVAISTGQSRGRRVSKEARDVLKTRLHGQWSKCAFQRARRLLFCPWARGGFDGTGISSSSAEWQ